MNTTPETTPPLTDAEVEAIKADLDLPANRYLMATTHARRLVAEVSRQRAEIERLQRENRTFEVMLPPLHAKIAELKSERAGVEALIAKLRTEATEAAKRLRQIRVDPHVDYAYAIAIAGGVETALEQAVRASDTRPAKEPT